MRGFAEYTEYDGLGLAALVRRREVSPERGAGGGDRADRGAEPDAQCRRHPGLRRGARRNTRWPAAWLRRCAVRRRAVPPERSGRRPGGRADDRRLALLRPCAGAGRCRDRGPLQAGGPAHPRAHQHAGVRTERLDRARAVRPDPQPLGPDPLERRLERRLGGRGRGPHGAARPCQRRRRLDPHPGVLLRPVRPEDHARPPVLCALCRRSAGRLRGRARGDAQRARQRGRARCHGGPGRRRPVLSAAAFAPVSRGGRHRACPAAHRARHRGVRRQSGRSRLHRRRRGRRHLVRGARPPRRARDACLRCRRARRDLQSGVRDQRRGQHPAARPHCSA